MEKKVYSFNEFLVECYNNDTNLMTEGKGGQGIDEALVIKILETQKKLADAKINKSNGGAKANPISVLHSESKKYYDELEQSEKDAILDELIKQATKKNIDAKWIEKKIEKALDSGKLLTNPKILVTKKSTPIPDEAKPEKPKDTPSTFTTVDLIPAETQGTFFKDNKWEYNKDDLSKTFQESYTIDGQSIKGTEMVQQIVNGIKGFIKQDVISKGKAIKSIKIESSCSRYRNKEEAEKLSWAQLGYNRSQTFAKMFKAAAEEAGADEEYLSKLLSKIEVDYLGSNGDGTSGPDPIGVRRGYYDASGWHDIKEGDLTDIYVCAIDASEGGITYGKTTKVKAKDEEGKDITEALKDKKEYEPFKFVSIQIETLPLDPENIPGGEDIVTPKEPEPTVLEEYKYVVTIYKDQKKKWKFPTFKFPPMRFFKKAKKRVRKARVIPCPKWN